MNTLKLVDLHTHTTASDGADSPAALVHKAHAAGLAAIAITDHDSLDGLEEARQAGQECGLKIIDGCELSARTEYGEIHILGLWLPPQAAQLQSRLVELRHKRAERNERIVAKLCNLGLELSMDDVYAVGRHSVGRPHIARAMLNRGLVSSEREAFEKYLKQGARAWLPKEVMEPQAAVSLMAGLGATVSLAHPFIQGYPEDWLEKLVQDLIPCGLSAIEAWHSEQNEAQTRICVEWARRYDLGLTGGSDYHGDIKPGIRLGVGRGGLRVPLDVLERLEARRHRQGLPC